MSYGQEARINRVMTEMTQLVAHKTEIEQKTASKGLLDKILTNSVLNCIGFWKFLKKKVKKNKYFFNHIY
jgi:hypothetical protein